MRPRKSQHKFKLNDYVEHFHTGIVKVVGPIMRSSYSGDEIFRGKVITSSAHYRNGTVIPDFLVECFHQVSKASLRQRGIII